MSAKTSHRRAARYAPQIFTDALQVTEWALTDTLGDVTVVQTLTPNPPNMVYVKGEKRKVALYRLVTSE